MSRKDKLVIRFMTRPRDFRWDELVSLLELLGYAEAKRGRTGGSRRRFVHETASVIIVHKPHPGKIVKAYVMDDLRKMFTDEGLI